MWSPTWIGERLRAEGLISQEDYATARANMKLHGERMEEALLRVGAIGEAALLKFVAEKSQTGYVPTAKLSTSQIHDHLLRLVPARTAEKLLAFPVRFDDASQTLSFVSPDAGNPELIKQLAIATGAKNVKTYVARPAAVRALIRKWYGGEIQSFSEIAPDTFTQLHGNLDFSERGLTQGDRPRAKRPPGAPILELEAPAQEYFLTPAPGGVAVNEAAAPGQPTTRARSAAEAPARSPRSVTAPMTIDPPSTLLIASRETQPRARGGPDRRLVDLAEMLSVMVALNESSRDEFRGHSASVARLGRELGRRAGLDELGQIELSLAGNLHDIGKPVAYHLTALNVAQYATHRSAAEKLAQTPVRLLESVALPSASTSSVAAMYERWDGQGFPSRLSGSSIPLGARVLSVCDTYSDLTQNPRNPYRRLLDHAEALTVVDKLKGTLFDPELVAHLSLLVTGEDLRKKLAGSVPQVLLVEPNLEEATVLELRLVAQGFEVIVARSSSDALAIAESGTIGYVLSETELEPYDGFELLARLRAGSSTRDLPFFFVARASDTASIDRGFAIGAQDYVVKPTSGDVLAGKLRRLTAPPRSRRDVSAGVAGSLSDMSLPDLTQILGQSRKSGRLTLRSGSREGEVHLLEGRVVHATAGALAGAEAFYELLGFTEGSFALDPSFQPPESTIQASAESLILEGLRRIDERNRDGH